MPYRITDSSDLRITDAGDLRTTDDISADGVAFGGSSVSGSATVAGGTGVTASGAAFGSSSVFASASTLIASAGRAVSGNLTTVAASVAVAVSGAGVSAGQATGTAFVGNPPAIVSGSASGQGSVKGIASVGVTGTGNARAEARSNGLATVPLLLSGKAVCEAKVNGSVTTGVVTTTTTLPPTTTTSTTTTTTTSVPTPCANNAVDEWLVCQLKRIPAVIAINAEVYHLEVYQNTIDNINTSELLYPCLVYQAIEQMPEQTLIGTTGLFHTTYQIVVLSKQSVDLRAVARGIKYFATDRFNQDIYYEGTNIMWVYVDGDSENCEFAIEQQEKGMKAATVNILIDHIDCIQEGE